MPTSYPSPKASTARALLWQALLGSRRDLAAATVLYSSHQIGESLVPVIIGGAIGHAVDGGSGRDMVLWLVLLGADFAFLSLSYRFGARAATRARQGTAHRVRMRLVEQVVSPTGSAGIPPGDLLSRASSDAGRIGSFSGQLAFTVATSVVLVTSTLLLLLRASLLLGVVIVVGTAIQILAQQRIWALLHQRSMSQQEHHARAASLAEDLVRGLRVLRGIGAQRTAATRYTEASQAAAGAALRATSSEAILGSVTALVAGLFLAIVAGVGGWLALHGHLGLGQFISALGLARFVVGPMEVVSGAAGAYARALASAERVHEVLAGADDGHHAEHAVGTPGGPDAPLAPAADLVLHEVEVGTAPPLSLAAGPGELVGIVAPDGGDAAALLRVLAGEASPAGGAITVAGRPFTSLSLDAWRATVLVAPHDAVLLPGSIEENIRLAARDSDLSPAIAAAYVDEVIATVPAGAATSVGDRGEALSGGQRQRVALARALAADPPVLVLHDPTTAIDAVTEDAVAEGVRRLRAGRTTLVLTSSPAWLARCDRVVLWHRDGATAGSHAELLAGPAAYRELVTR